MQADRVGVAASRRARASTSRLCGRTMRPRRSPDPWRHHPLERVWCSIRSGSFSVGLSYTSAVLGLCPYSREGRGCYAPTLRGCGVLYLLTTLLDEAEERRVSGIVGQRHIEL